MNALLPALLAAPVALALLSLRYVPQGRAYTVHRFGRFVRSMGPGLHLVLPLVERIGHRVELIGHRVELSRQGLATAAVFYQILEPERAGASLDAVDEVVQHEADAILDEVAANQPDPGVGLCDSLKAELNRRLGPRGLRVTRCKLQAA
jgi:regulator of protease activity HflC (stomatin/prohibitin superfamily)